MKSAGLALVLAAVAFLVWGLCLHGLKHFSGTLALGLVAAALVVLAVGTGMLGGRGLLGAFLLLVGLVGLFLAALPDPEGVLTFRLAVLALSVLLVAGGFWLLVSFLAKRHGASRSNRR